MHALILQHVAADPPGIWAEALDVHGVSLDVVRVDLDGPPPSAAGYDLIVALGGPQSACAAEREPWLADEMELLAEAVHGGVGFLGVCLGAQLLATALGGTCRPGGGFEFGLRTVATTATSATDPVFGPVRPGLVAFAFHGDAFTLPPAGVRLATSPACVNEVMRWGPAAYGVQFHLEASVEDVAGWLQLPCVDEVRSTALADGGDRFLTEYARAVPGLRDLAAGIVDRWLGTVRRRRPSTALVTGRS
jgi:GMP synthase (glutamine-hydrolysing)